MLIKVAANHCLNGLFIYEQILHSALVFTFYFGGFTLFQFVA